MTLLTDTLERPVDTQSKPVAVRLAVAEYDRTRPLMDGRVVPEGITLKTSPMDIGTFCMRPVYEEYDAAEMSLSWYVMARMRGEPVIALPIFPLRMPVLTYVFVRKDSPYQKPADLIGKRVASQLYRITVNLWLRGIFQEHYGLKPEQLEWVTTEPAEGAGFTIPKGIRVTNVPGTSPEALLERGEVDAIFMPEIPAQFTSGTSNMRRLFSDAQGEMQSFVRKTGQLPITHTIVMHQQAAERQPWMARSLTRAFVKAQEVCDAFWHADPKHLSFPDMAFFLEQQRAAYGVKPYQHYVEPNRKVLETFVRYACEQGYIARIPKLDELFVPIEP